MSGGKRIGCLKLGVLADFAEERWASMDLFAEMLVDGLRADWAGRVEPLEIRPAWKRRAVRLPMLGKQKAAVNLDRLANRLWDYPLAVRKRVEDCGLFHLCDHSYAQLLHETPKESTGVFCHDLDTFRSVLEPEQEPRPAWFRSMSNRILEGFRKAAVVFHTTQVVRGELLRHGLVDPQRLVVCPPGVSSEFRPESNGEPPPEGWKVWPERFVLHVGSCIPRKRVDLLLDVFAGLRRRDPTLTLVQLGGRWTDEQREQIQRLKIDGVVRQAQGLTRGQIAEGYRRAEMVMVTSDLEGFGLPAAEALACGAVLLCSDIEVLREVAGAAAVYCPPGQVDPWVDAAIRLLDQPQTAPSRAARLAQGGKYSWAEHTRIIAETYLKLHAGEPLA